jgi:hypothetical protein
MNVTLNGTAKTITVNTGVSAITIKKDVYSAWKSWVLTDTNAKFLPAVRTIGGDPVGGGLYDVYFLMNGWKLVVDFTQTQVSGVLFSDDYPTAFYTPSMVPQYPASVSALVSGISTTGGGTSAGLTTAESAAILGAAQANDILAKLTAINEGLKKASLLIPHTANLP